MADRFDFEALPVEKLWNLYHDIRGVLTAKLSEQKRDLDNRLRSLSQVDVERDNAAAGAGQPEDMTSRGGNANGGTRRAYPKVMPLYRNPAEPSETWSGRGNKPRWLAAQVNAGRDITEFLIKPPASRSAAKPKSTAKSKTR